MDLRSFLIVRLDNSKGEKSNCLTNWNLAFIFIIENMLWMLKGIASLRRFFWAPVNRFWSGWMGEFSQFYAKLIGVNVGRCESARKAGLLIWVIIAMLWERARLYRILVVCHSIPSSARHNFFHFRSISWGLFYRIYPNFVCALIFAWSSLGLLHVIFPKIVPELRPLIYAKISFPLNILRTHRQNFTKFYNAPILTRSSLGLLHLNFLHICTRVMVLDLRQNFVFAQYLENSFIEFIQILYVHWYWHGLAWDSYISFSQICTSYGPKFNPKFCFCSKSWEQNDRISQNFIYAFQGTKYFNIALILQDEWLTSFTRPANTCTCPLKVYAIKNI